MGTHMSTHIRGRGWWLVLASVAIAGCGIGTEPQDSTSPGPAASTESPTATITDYPRPEQPSTQYTIGIALPHLSNPHYVGQAYGYLDEAAALGVNVTMLEAGGYQYLDKQVAQIEDLVASKVDAIILAAVNGPGTLGAVENAVAAGIPVINVNVMTDSDMVVTRVRSDDDVIGRMHADLMGERLNGEGSVVMLRGAPGTSWAEIRGNAFKARLAERFPNITIVGEQYSQSTPADGLRLMEDFIQTFPQIDGVYNGADTTAVGAAQAVLAAGKTGEIVMTATDFQIDTENFIREGVITGSVLQQTVTMGRWGIRAAVNHLEQRQVPPVLFTTQVLVTAESLETIDLSGVRAPDGWTPPAH